MGNIAKSYNDVMQELREKLEQFNSQSEAIQALADSESRDLTEDELKEIAELNDAFDKTESEIATRQRVRNQGDKLRVSQGMPIDKEEPEAEVEEIPPVRNQVATRQSRSVTTARIEAMRTPPGMWGWNNFGEFAVSVRRACAQGGIVDPRLIANAPTTYGQEAVGADGGFAVPPDIRGNIMQKVTGEESLLGRTDQMVSASNVLTFPKDETTPWGSSGLQAYWEGEGDQLRQSKPALKDTTIRLNKLAALVPVTEELLEDAPAMDAYLNRKVPEVFNHKISLAIIRGTGSGQPLGIMNSDCLVTVAKDTSTSPIQAADTFLHQNVVDMWTRMYAPSRARAVWIMHQDVEPQLHTMAFRNNKITNPVPVYLPPGGVNDSPYGRLLGRPVIFSQTMETVGDLGDVLLADLTQYTTVLKTGGLRTDVSMHLWFDYDMLSYRFIFRVGGHPWWSAAIDPRDGSNTLSCFVTLAERA
jgi:HK97 family phage major capsid protein